MYGRNLVRVGAVFIAALVGACFVDIDLSETSYQCSDGVCPAGYTCVAAMCVSDIGGADGSSNDAAGIDGGADIDSGTGVDGGAQPITCGKITNISDDFDDGWLDWGTFFAQNGATSSEMNGRITLALPESPVDVPWVDLLSNLTYNFRDTSTTVQVVSMVGNSAFAGIRLRAKNSDDEVNFMKEGSVIRIWARVAGATTIDVDSPYNATNDRWWRIREEQGTVFFDTSPDGQNWSERLSGVTPPFLASAQLEFLAGTGIGTTGNGSFVLDNLNLNAPSPTWCKATTMTDAFTGTNLGPNWHTSEVAGCVFTQDGDLTIDTPLNLECFVRTATRYDLTNSQVTVEMTQSLADAAVGATSLIIDASGGDGYIQLYLGTGQLGLFYCNTVSCPPLVDLGEFSQQHRWWRISESGGMVDLSTSPDGSTWSSLHQFDPGLNLSDIQVRYTLDSYGGVLSSSMDNYNVLP